MAPAVSIARFDRGLIARGAGYDDHADMVADFRDLVGLTPTATSRDALRERPRDPR